MKARKKVEERKPEHTSVIYFGFAVVESEGAEHLQCVICCKILAAECMLPIKLRCHLPTNHNYLSSKSRDFFIRKLSEMNKHYVIFSNFLPSSFKAIAQRVSFKVAF